MVRLSIAVLADLHWTGLPASFCGSIPESCLLLIQVEGLHPPVAFVHR